MLKPIGDDKYVVSHRNKKIGVGKVNVFGKFIERKNIQGNPLFWRNCIRILSANKLQIEHLQNFCEPVSKSEDILRTGGYYVKGYWFENVYLVDFRWQIKENGAWKSGRGITLNLRELYSLIEKFPEAVTYAHYSPDQAAKVEDLGKKLEKEAAKNCGGDFTKAFSFFKLESTCRHLKTLFSETLPDDLFEYYCDIIILFAQLKFVDADLRSAIIGAQATYDYLKANNLHNEKDAKNRFDRLFAGRFQGEDEVDEADGTAKNA